MLANADVSRCEWAVIFCVSFSATPLTPGRKMRSRTLVGSWPHLCNIGPDLPLPHHVDDSLHEQPRALPGGGAPQHGHGQLPDGC